MQHLIGIISDTHGLVRPEMVKALAGSEIIIHAGDVGSPHVLEQLQDIAPVFAIRGNIDKGDWAKRLPETEVVPVGSRFLYVLHNLNELDLDPGRAGFDCIISGHSHQPKMEQRDGILYFNPGSAGPRRFKLPVTVGRLQVGPQGLNGEIVQLDMS